LNLSDFYSNSTKHCYGKRERERESSARKTAVCYEDEEKGSTQHFHPHTGQDEDAHGCEFMILLGGLPHYFFFS